MKQRAKKVFKRYSLKAYYKETLNKLLPNLNHIMETVKGLRKAKLIKRRFNFDS